MRIDVWSDIVCPFCYIGMKRLRNALDTFPNKEDITVHVHSFLLAPKFNPDGITSVYEYLSLKNGLTLAQAHDRYKQVTEIAKKDGLHFDFDKAVPCNSITANRLMQLAWKEGKQLELEEKLFAAYFSEGKNLNDTGVLCKLCEEAGISPERAREVCNSREFIEEVNSDIHKASELGIVGIPYFLFDGDVCIKGAQPKEVFIDAIAQMEVKFRNKE